MVMTKVMSRRWCCCRLFQCLESLFILYKRSNLLFNIIISLLTSPPQFLHTYVCLVSKSNQKLPALNISLPKGNQSAKDIRISIIQSPVKSKWTALQWTPQNRWNFVWNPSPACQFFSLKYSFLLIIYFSLQVCFKFFWKIWNLKLRKSNCWKTNLPNAKKKVAKI